MVLVVIVKVKGRQSDIYEEKHAEREEKKKNLLREQKENLFCGGWRLEIEVKNMKNSVC